MNVDRIMTKAVVAVGLDDDLEHINKIFSRKRFHHILVMDEGKLYGVISDRDVLKTMSPFLHTMSELPRDLATLKKRAHQIMHRKPITVNPKTPLAKAIKLLAEEEVSCLPVVDEDDNVVGIITWKDLVKLVHK